jgi:hypothetical protein
MVNAAAAYGGDRSGPFGGGPIAEAAPDGFDSWAAAPARAAFSFLSAGGPPEALADPRRIADAVLFLANQDARSATHELQLTPLAENWTP